MERKKRFDAKRLSTRIALVVLIVTTSLILAGSGCGRQIAGVKEYQFKLQDIVLNNSRQIAGNIVYIEETAKAVNDIEQKQTKLQEQIVAIQNDTNLLRKNMIAVLKQLKEELSRISSQISSAETAKK